MLFVLSWLLLWTSSGQQSAGKMVGTKIVLRYTVGARTSKYTIYIAGDRRRIESTDASKQPYAPGLVDYLQQSADTRIVRCDLGEAFDLNSAELEYVAEDYPPKWMARTRAANNGAETPAIVATPGPRVEVTTVDTSERADILEHVARHVITTAKVVQNDDPRSRFQGFVRDGWYIDFDPGISCAPALLGEIKFVTGSFQVGGVSVPVGTPEIIETGPRETGFALREVQRPADELVGSSASHGPSGPNYEIRVLIPAYEMEVIEFTQGPLDPPLFDIPPGFKRVPLLQ
jgi:hypothetical protein